MNGKPKVYLICPVRNVQQWEADALRDHVRDLEESNYEVHFPPRDVDQSNDDGGVRICKQHRKALFESDEVHVFWNNASTGSHFDLGMAYMLDYVRQQKGLPPIKFFSVNTAGIDSVQEKSFQNVIYRLIGDTVMARGAHAKAPESPDFEFKGPLAKDSGERFLEMLVFVASHDVEGLKKAFKSYGPSWKSRGGIGAFMMLARKWDRMDNRLRKVGWDIFRGIATDKRGEGLIDDVRDLRRYLMLVEAEMVARGFQNTSRDNKPEATVNNGSYDPSKDPR